MAMGGGFFHCLAVMVRSFSFIAVPKSLLEADYSLLSHECSALATK
jgi:hypothetical protein